MRRLILILFFVGIPVSVIAQINNIVTQRQIINSTLQPLNKENILTGLLLDNAIDYVDFDQYNGTELNDANYVDKMIYLDMLRGVRSSAVLESPIDPISEITDYWHSVSGERIMPISFALYKYDYLPESSLENNLVQYTNGKLYADVVATKGDPLYPYSQKHIIGFSPVLNICQSGSITFTFPVLLGFTNESLRKIEFNPGVGTEYINVLPNVSCSIQYPQGNYKVELKMRFTLSNGQVLVCHSPMYIRTYDNVDEDDNGITNISFTSSTPYQGITTSAQVQICYASGRTSLQKPLIIAEGFDPVELAFLNTMSSGSDDILGFTKFKRNVYSRYSDYDIVYVNWDHSDQYIQANANLLIDVIDWVNANKALDSEGIVLCGESMGGLIARYALCKMEEEGRIHNVDIYVSYDSPHLGANVPLGLLYLLTDANAFISDVLSDDYITELLGLENIDPQKLSALSKYLYAPSVTQMLINYVDSSGDVDNSLHNEWQDELLDIGFPQGDPGKKMIRLAVSNGGVTDITSVSDYVDFNIEGFFWSSIFLALDKALCFSGYPLWDLYRIYIVPKLNLERLWPGKHTISAHFNVKPYDANSRLIYNGQIKYKKSKWLLNPYEVTIYSNSQYPPVNGIPMDDLPGSYYDMSIFSSYMGGFDDIDAVVAGVNILDTMITDKIMFIPTASSLCYGNGLLELTQTDYHKDFYNLRNTESNVPFHGIYIIDEATNHISEMPDVFGVAEWIDEHRKYYISGSSAPTLGDVYSVEGSASNISWFSSNENVISIDSNTGQVISLGTGEADIIAKYVHNGYTVTLIKTVFVGFPEIYLEESLENNLYGVNLRCVNPDFDKYLSYFSFKWTKEDMCLTHSRPLPGTFSWTTSSEPTYTIGVPHSEYGWNVYVKLVDQEGNESDSYNIRVRPNMTYSMNPDVIIVNGSGARFIKNDSAVVPMVQNAILLFALESNEADAPDLYKIRVREDPQLAMGWDALGTESGEGRFLFNWLGLKIDYALDELLKPNGNKDRIVWDFILYSNDGEVVQEIPFLMYYDEDYAPVL